MKAISLLQPWASLVISGAKTIETRSWNSNFRGWILIHASRGKGGMIFSGHPLFKKFISDFSALPFGYIIGKVVVTDIIKIASLDLKADKLNDMSIEEKAFGDYTPGRYAWILEDPVPFERPITARGSLNIWNFPDEALGKIEL